VKVNKATNAITYTDLKGNIITAEDSENKTITQQLLLASVPTM
jgi:alpha-D-xyloside xylohydrolase